MSRMPRELAERHSLFLHVSTHPQLQYYFNLSETRRSANQSGLLGCCDSQPHKVVEIHPIKRPLKAQHPR